MLQNKAEMFQLLETTPVLSVLRATSHSKDPVMACLGAFNSNSAHKIQMGFKSYINTAHNLCGGSPSSNLATRGFSNVCTDFEKLLPNKTHYFLYSKRSKKGMIESVGESEACYKKLT